MSACAGPHHRLNACYAFLLEVKGTLFLVGRACFAVRDASRRHQYGAGRKGPAEGVGEQWSRGMAELKTWEHLTRTVTAFLNQLEAYCTVSPPNSYNLDPKPQTQNREAQCRRPPARSRTHSRCWICGPPAESHADP